MGQTSLAIHTMFLFFRSKDPQVGPGLPRTGQDSHPEDDHHNRAGVFRVLDAVLRHERLASTLLTHLQFTPSVEK